MKQLIGCRYELSLCFVAARTGQLPIFVLNASEYSIFRVVCLVICLLVLKFVSLFYQFPVPAE